MTTIPRLDCRQLADLSIRFEGILVLIIVPAVGWTSAAQSTSNDAGFGGLRYRWSTLRCPVVGTVIKAGTGLDHKPGHRAICGVAGPHSGPYRSRCYRRVRCADPPRPAGTMIKAVASIPELYQAQFR